MPWSLHSGSNYFNIELILLFELVSYWKSMNLCSFFRYNNENWQKSVLIFNILSRIFGGNFHGKSLESKNVSAMFGESGEFITVVCKSAVKS